MEPEVLLLYSHTYTQNIKCHKLL